MAQLSFEGPLGEFNLADQRRFEPGAALHLRGGDVLGPAPALLLGQVGEGAFFSPEFLKARVQVAQKRGGATRADLAGKFQLFPLENPTSRAPKCARVPCGGV